jgi:phosphatidylserine synthase
LARFNVSNEHGEQHHMSFLGLPSPGAAAAVIGMVLVQQELSFTRSPGGGDVTGFLAATVTYLLPPIVLACGLLMISVFRYSHLINQHLRGRRPVPQLVGAVILIALLLAAHRYTIGIVTVFYALSAPLGYLLLWRRRHVAAGS